MDNQNQPQPISSNPAPINKENKDAGFYRKRAWLKWLLIYFVIAILIYGGAYLVLSRKTSKPYSINHPNSTITVQPTTTSDKTSNWKTYRNEEFGFEVRYPDEEWGLKEFPGGSIEFRSRERQYNVIFIDILPVEKGKTADEVMIAKTGLGECGGSDCRHPSRDQFLSRKLGENSFYYIRDNLFEAQYSVLYYLFEKDNNRIIRFRLSSFTRSGKNWTDTDYDVDTEPDHSLLKQILSMFRFVKPIGK